MINSDKNNYDGQDAAERTAAVSLVKKQRRNDSIGWLVGAIIIFFITIISAGRLTLIGQFLDDVVFTFVFGWFKYLIYVCLLILGVAISSGVKIKIKLRAKLMIVAFCVVICWLVSSIILLIMFSDYGDNQIPMWSKDIFSKIMNNYLNHWQTASIFAQGKDSLSFIYFNGQWVTLFAGGGVIGGFISAIFSYASIIGNLIICLIVLFFTLSWIIGGDWRAAFGRKYANNSLHVVGLYSKHRSAPRKHRSRFAFYKDINLDDESEYASRQVMHTTEQSDITIQMPSITNIHNRDILEELTENKHRRHRQRGDDNQQVNFQKPETPYESHYASDFEEDYYGPGKIKPRHAVDESDQRFDQYATRYIYPEKSAESIKIPTKEEYIMPRRNNYDDMPVYKSAYGPNVSLEEARSRLSRDAQLSPFSRGDAQDYSARNRVDQPEDNGFPIDDEKTPTIAEDVNYIAFDQSSKIGEERSKEKADNDPISPFGNSYQSATPSPISVDRSMPRSVPESSTPQPPRQQPAPVQRNKVNRAYRLPSLELLNPKQVNTANNDINMKSAKVKAAAIDEIFQTFGVGAKVINAIIGPTVTKFEISLDPGVKVNKIIGLENDLKLALATPNVRMEAPIQGKSAVGLEVANERSNKVPIRDLMERIPAKYKDNHLTVALGETVTGDILFAELNKMPHLLIAGSTGSGKSVCINTIIASMILRTKPHELKLMLIDPKQVELAVYNDLPHLIAPVISNTKQANNALKKIIVEMDRRYSLLTENGVRNIESYNEKAKREEDKLPYIVVVIDELADLMITTGREVEESIMRITQLARAAGIHLILATQRPSTNIITGVIKNNVPSRIAFSVASGHDSRTILDHIGAERLIGQGDMLYAPIGQNTPIRAQGAFISDDEIERLVEYAKSQQEVKYEEDFLNLEKDFSQNTMFSGEVDEVYNEVKQFIILSQKASTSLIQRKFGLGYNRASRIIEAMEEDGVIGPQNGAKPREVYIKPDN